MKIYLEDGSYMPTRAHTLDAGLDLKAPHDFDIYPGERKDIDTGVHVKLPTDSVGFVTSKSGLMRDNGIISQGTVDASYRGSIHAVLINTSRQIVSFKTGQKIAQLVIVPCLFVDTEQCFSLSDLGQTDRGEQGFGSTGKT